MTDYTKSPEEILADLINDANGTTVPVAGFVFGVPEALTTPGASRNTKVQVTGLPANGAAGLIEVTYNRVDINTVPGALSRVFDKGAFTRTAELLPAVNLAYAINLRAQDVVDAALPDAGLAGQLQIVPEALVYFGALDFQLQADAPPPPAPPPP